MNPPYMIGIIYNTLVSAACRLASVLQGRPDLKDRAWICPAESVDTMISMAPSTDLVITVGGDGTILRAVQLAASYQIPILGINMGRLGFMTELEGHEALEQLPKYLNGDPWVEERSMIQVRILGEDGSPKGSTHTHHSLNDAVISRGSVSRLITIKAIIDDGNITTYRADAVMVATATGSTGYNLAVGGPILYPQADLMVITPVAPHLGLASGLVVPGTSEIQFVLESDLEATLSVDGYVNLPLNRGEGIHVTTSPLKARFLRVHPPSHFYHTLTRRLDFGGAVPRATSMGP